MPTVTIGKKTAQRLTDEWDQFHKEFGMENPAPPGAICAGQYAARFGVTFRKAQSILDSQHTDGVLDRGVFRTNVNGKFRRLRFYWKKRVLTAH